MLSLLVSSVWAGGYLHPLSGIGISTQYNQENPSIFTSGLHLNLGINGGVIHHKKKINSYFFHSRFDLDVGTTHSMDNLNHWGIDFRGSIHGGIQYRYAMPINLAVKDFRWRTHKDNEQLHGLYGVGIMIPKDYFLSSDGNVANVSCSFGVRQHSRLSSLLFGIQPELAIMQPRYSVIINALTTLGSPISSEFSSSGTLLFRPIPRMQIGIQWRYTELFDQEKAFDNTNNEYLFFISL
jgi:hypothetical protein